MKRNKKQKNKRQMELNLQVKESAQIVKSVKIDKAIQPVNSAKSIKSAKLVKAKLSNTGLSKKSTKSKVKRKACGHKTSTGLLFDNLITIEELAVIFGLAPQTIRNWVAQGKLPHVKLGKRNWFLTGSLQKWLNQKEKPQWL